MEPGTLSELDIPSEIIDIVPADIARKYQIVPLERKGPFLVIGVLDPTDTPLIDELKVVLGENFLMPTQMPKATLEVHVGLKNN